jgi:hypothetical protein
MDCQCGKPIPEKRAKLGYDKCIRCAEKYTRKYLGVRIDGKHGGETVIMREDLKHAQKIIKMGNRIGPNIGLGHPVTEQAKEDFGEDD